MLHINVLMSSLALFAIKIPFLVTFFAALLYFASCFSVSRESWWLVCYELAETKECLLSHFR